MTPVGSSGDVHPFIGIGRALRARGHEVVVVTSEPFRTVAEQAGLAFHPTHSSEAFHELTGNADLWHPRRGLQLILRAVGQVVREEYRHIGEVVEAGRSMLVGHTLSFAARTFEEVHDVPAATLHLAPSVFRSDHQQPAYVPGFDLSGAPRWFKRGAWSLIDRLAIDPHVLPALNAWRRDLGLPPVARVFRDWLHSPRLVIGLFPPWFGPPQPDWPAALRLTGFPLYDQSDQDEVPADVEAFLGDGPAPLVFTPGSANRWGRPFFDAAVEATTRLGARALLLTRYREQLPPALPASVRHAPYVPLSAVLPRCAALIHHGGIGTCAQGLAAGVPQLTMPMGFDQPDNATRLSRLGVGRWVVPRRFSGPRVAAALHALLDDDAVRTACRRWAGRLREERPVDATCDLLEQVAAGGSV